jgi:hypothetical protein
MVTIAMDQIRPVASVKWGYVATMSIVAVHVDCGSLNALGGKSLISGTVSTFLLGTYDLILDFLLSQHKTNLNRDVFGTNTFLVVIGVENFYTFQHYSLGGHSRLCDTVQMGANLSILSVYSEASHIMINGSVCIIEDTMIIYMEHFHNANSTCKCEQLMWILLHILHKL